MIRFAFGSVPKDGGTFTFYRNIRPALREHGIDMRCVAIGKAQAELWEEAYVDEGCVLLAPGTRNIRKQAQVFVDWCEQEKINIVMGINSEAILSALPHLPQKIRCMSRCANSFDHGYRITVSGYERLAGIVAQTPRQLQDLCENYGADPKHISVIPNGISPSLFEEAVEGRRWGGIRQGEPSSRPNFSEEYAPIRLGFIGRLEHNQKGVLFLPSILRELKKSKVPYTFHIAGKGRHGEQLKKEIDAIDPEVRYHGAIPPSDVPRFLAETDVFLFPSQFEGCPNALIEAMMAGCAPVAWLLDGITDFVVEDGVSGHVAPLEDHRQFAERIAIYANDRSLLEAHQRAAAEQARQRFHSKVAAARYAEVLRSVYEVPAPEWIPKPWKDFKSDPSFEHSWRDRIPKSIKNIARSLFLPA